MTGWVWVAEAARTGKPARGRRGDDVGVGSCAGRRANDLQPSAVVRLWPAQGLLALPFVDGDHELHAGGEPADRGNHQCPPRPFGQRDRGNHPSPCCHQQTSHRSTLARSTRGLPERTITSDEHDFALLHFERSEGLVPPPDQEAGSRGGRKEGLFVVLAVAFLCETS